MVRDQEGGYKPIMASGKLVDDYGPLKYYWNALRKRYGHAELVKTEFFKDAEKILSNYGSRVSASEVIEQLSNVVASQIDGEAAVLALKEYYGRDYSLDDARKIIARIISGYVLEFLESLGKIKLSQKKGFE